MIAGNCGLNTPLASLPSWPACARGRRCPMARAPACQLVPLPSGWLAQLKKSFIDLKKSEGEASTWILNRSIADSRGCLPAVASTCPRPRQWQSSSCTGTLDTVRERARTFWLCVAPQTVVFSCCIFLFRSCCHSCIRTTRQTEPAQHCPARHQATQARQLCPELEGLCCEGIKAGDLYKGWVMVRQAGLRQLWQAETEHEWVWVWVRVWGGGPMLKGQCKTEGAEQRRQGSRSGKHARQQRQNCGPSIDTKGARAGHQVAGKKAGGGRQNCGWEAG